MNIIIHAAAEKVDGIYPAYQHGRDFWDTTTRSYKTIVGAKRSIIAQNERERHGGEITEVHIHESFDGSYRVTYTYDHPIAR